MNCGGAAFLGNHKLIFCLYKVVLTAAHCIVDLVISGLQLQSVDAWVGLENLNDRGNAVFAQVANAVPHPNYNANTDENDIMLLRLAQPVTTVPIVALNFDPFIPLDFSPTEVMGYGLTSEDGPRPDTLQVASISVIPHADCNDVNSYDGAVNNNLMICAGTANGFFGDACQVSIAFVVLV